MKVLALALSVLLACGALAAESGDAPPSPCGLWTLNGFRIGMTIGEAEQVRPMAEMKDAKNEPGERRFMVLLDDGRTGELIFDAESHVVNWGTESKLEMATRIRAALTERFGPVTEDHSADKIPYVAWASAECDSRVLVMEVKILSQVLVQLGSVRRFTAGAKKSLGIP